jgi:S-DNA-T family DNA segregation ATPase FtsK/SpoIIIE
LADVFVVLAIALVAGWLLLAWAIVKRPILSLPAAAGAGLVVWLGAHDAQAIALYVLIVLGVWRLVHKRSYQRLVGRRLRASWRRLWVYERRWRTTMVHSGLAKRYRLRESVPSIRAVRCTPWCDRVLLRLIPGQCTEDVERVSPELAHSFRARSCRIREDRPGRLWLELATGDPLVEVVPALPVPEVVDLGAVPVGLQEDGDPWRLRVLGTHLLIAGATGSGKGLGAVVAAARRGAGDSFGSGGGVGDRSQGRHGARPGPRAVRVFAVTSSGRWRSCSRRPWA